MNTHQEAIDKRWTDLQQALKAQFGQDVDTTSALFLVGVQEAGQGFGNFSREEKWNLIHLGGARVLSYWGYFSHHGTNPKSGLPHWEPAWEKPAPDDQKREALFREGLVKYFEEMGYDF